MPTIADIRALFTDTTVNVSIGAFIMSSYIATHFVKKKKDKLNLTTVLVIFYSSYSLFSGVAILLIGFDKVAQTIKGIEPTAYFVAGFSTVYVGIKEIHDKFSEI